MLESNYQHGLIGRIEKRLPGCFIIKNDPNLRQGIPDLLVLYKRRWGFLEVKASEKAPPRPNQPYFVLLFDEMSFAAFIYPENEEEVLNELEYALKLRR